MSQSVTDVSSDHLETIIEYSQQELRDTSVESTFPWHIARAMLNRIEKSDEESVTVNNSHIRMIVGSIERYEEESQIEDAVQESLNTIKEQVSESEE